MKKNSDRLSVLLTLVFFVLIATLTVGYAFTDKILTIGGTVEVYRIGKFEIEKVEKISGNLPNDNGQGLILNDDGSLGLDLKFKYSKSGENDYTATYLITMFNDTHTDHVFTGFNIEPVVNISGTTSDQAGATVGYEYVNNSQSNLDIVNNNIIPAGERRILAVKLNIHAGSNKSGVDIGVSGEGEIYTSEDTSGTFYGYLDPTEQTLDLQNNIRDCFEFKVLNTYKSAKSFSIRPGNSNFEFVDSNGNALSSFSIQAPSEDNPENNIGSYSACIRSKASALFLNDVEKTTVIIDDGQVQNSIGSLNVSVIKVEAKDEEKVHIGPVSFSVINYDSSTNNLNVKASWSHLPDESDKSTSVQNYYIMLYKSGSSTPVYTFTVDGDATINDYRFKLNSSNYLNERDMVTNNLNYYIKVYGVDAAGNTGKNDCNSNTDFCVTSSEISLKYKFKVTLKSNNNNVSFVNTASNVYLNEAFSNQLKVSSSGYSLNSSVTISMTGHDDLADGTDYTFGLNSGSTTQGTLNIKENVIKNDITITAKSSDTSGWCLIEGTKIRLANGKTKNIEDIKYDDLIIAISHDSGEIVYEYPIWIETKGVADEYQITTFSDGSTLKTVGPHGVFSIDSNEYVSVLDREKFHIGTNVVKIDNDNQKTSVYVTKIETKKEKVNYYHVSSTYYHNVIAENLLTTDALLVVSNMYSFDKNLKWSNEREEFLKKNDLFIYEDWQTLFPSHIFKGFRMAEAKILTYKGLLDIGLFDRVLNAKMVEPPKTKLGNNKWMVTVQDNLSILENQFYEEGSIYTLPKPIKTNKIFLGWYNHADNKYYQPGDKIKIIYGMYFEAKWL